MNCKDCTLQISLALDDRLTPEHDREVRSHIDNCVACSRERAEQARLRTLLNGLDGPEPESVKSEVLERLRPADSRTREARLILLEEIEHFARWFVPAAAVLLVVLGGFALRGFEDRSRTATDVALAEDYLVAEASYDTSNQNDVWGLSPLLVDAEAQP